MNCMCIESKNPEQFTKGKEYKMKRIFPQWPWMVMVWDNYGVGRYIHDGGFGEFKVLVDESIPSNEIQFKNVSGNIVGRITNIGS